MMYRFDNILSHTHVSGLPCRWDLANTSPGCRFYLSNESVTGAQSQGIAYTSSTKNSQENSQAAGVPSCAISNRGLDGGGLHLVAGRPYRGYLFARASADTHLPVSLVVGLSDRLTRAALASQVLSVTSTAWTRLNFSLTPNATTECHATSATASRTCHANAENLCPVCSGEFSVGFGGVDQGGVEVDQTYLGPGAWGQYRGLPTRLDVVERIQVSECVRECVRA